VLDLPSPEGGSLDGVLGMNFFWNRNVTFEPSLMLSPFLHVSDPLPIAFCDNDVDLDVDGLDVGYFLTCFTGPGVVNPGPECAHLDVAPDGRLDLRDFARVQACFSGADMESHPACAG